MNQLLLGRTSTSNQIFTDIGAEDHGSTSAYQKNLLDTWWSLWKQQGFPTLLPYQRHKDAKRHKDLKKGDVCLVMYESIVEIFQSVNNVVRTVRIGFRPRHVAHNKGVYKHIAFEEIDVAVQRLVLLVPAEELKPEQQDEMPVGQ